MKINPQNTGNTINAGLLQDGYRQKTTGDFQKLVQQAQTEKDDRKLKEACQEIEAIFIHQMLQEMRATIPQNGFLQDSNATKIYRDMLDQEYSKLMAASHDSFGLGEMLYKQLTRQNEKTPENNSTE